MPLYEVLDDGTVKQVAGNTHTNYIAGNGLNIDENNVISVPTKSYASYKFPVVNINSSSSPSAELTITTTGRPVYISLTGDVNPMSAEGTDDWCKIYLYRDGLKLTTEVVTEKTGSSNRPFAVTFLDQVSAGTHTYKAQFVIGSGALMFGEEDGAFETPDFTIFEI